MSRKILANLKTESRESLRRFMRVLFLLKFSPLGAFELLAEGRGRRILKIVIPEILNNSMIYANYLPISYRKKPISVLSAKMYDYLA